MNSGWKPSNGGTDRPWACPAGFMRQIEPDQPGAASHEEERLRKENQDLRRQLQELKSRAHSTSENDLPAHVWRPSGITIAALLLTAVVLLVVAFFAGYIPLQKQRDLIISEAHEQETALPRVDVIKVGRSSNHSELQLPGSIQAIDRKSTRLNF